MSFFLSRLNDLVWGAPALLMILAVGLYLTIQLHGVQVTLFPKALRCFFQKLVSAKQTQTGCSPFRALCTALAATVGTGNLAGVAGAICLGGPGSIFWMWISGLLGMVTKYAEATLAVRYRVKAESGHLGGPMYVMLGGMGEKARPLAAAYCLLGMCAAFGVGNAAQINAAVSGINGVLPQWGISPSTGKNLIIGIVLSACIGPMLLGGSKRIGAAAEQLVPVAAAGYILMCIGALIRNRDAIPDAFSMIVQGAFSPKAATGGMLGSSIQALRVGCSRGVFTNEAGMGTAAIAHADASVSHPAEQGLMGIMEVFLDTIVICTLTALVILTSAVPIPYGTDVGAALTGDAFSTVYGDASVVILAAALTLFASASILGWGLYGARCAEFLFGVRAWKPFALAQILVIVTASVMDTGAVWQLSEVLNGLMVIPNLITLAVLTPEVIRLTKEYRKSGK